MIGITETHSVNIFAELEALRGRFNNSCLSLTFKGRFEINSMLLIYISPVINLRPIQKRQYTLQQSKSPFNSPKYSVYNLIEIYCFCVKRAFWTPNLWLHEV